MLTVLYSEKGSGKTKTVIGEANRRLENAKGTIVYINNDKNYTKEINYQIRFIDASEYNIDSPKMFFGFISGIAAQDFDLEAIFIDGFTKIVKHDLGELEGMFKSIQDFAEKFSVDIMMSITGESENIPEYIKNHLFK